MHDTGSCKKIKSTNLRRASSQQRASKPLELVKCAALLPFVLARCVRPTVVCVCASPSLSPPSHLLACVYGDTAQPQRGAAHGELPAPLNCDFAIQVRTLCTSAAAFFFGRYSRDVFATVRFSEHRVVTHCLAELLLPLMRNHAADKPELLLAACPPSSFPPHNASCASNVEVALRVRPLSDAEARRR